LSPSSVVSVLPAGKGAAMSGRRIVIHTSMMVRMRLALATALFLGACGGAGGGAKAGGAAALPRLVAAPLLEGETVVLDGATGDPVWTRAREILLPLSGPGPDRVHLKAAYDDERIYLFAIWPDPEVTTGRYYEFTSDRKWIAHDDEDGFGVCWSPAAEAARFREQGCALYCHDDNHRYLADEGAVDFWSWRAQQTRPHNQARDMWLPAGRNQRLRGDGQPEESDNYPNLREKVFAPKYVPFRVSVDSRRFLWPSNINELPTDWTSKLDPEQNIGWQVAMDILRPMKGSRGDIEASARHVRGSWILELARARATGHRDDEPLVDLRLPHLFAVAIHEGGAGPKRHSTSGPVELVFESR